MLDQVWWCLSVLLVKFNLDYGVSMAEPCILLGSLQLSLAFEGIFLFCHMWMSCLLS